MTTFPMPGLRPANPNFSSGPCAKRPGWSLDALANAALGRSHRAKIGKSKLEQAIELTRDVLQVPADYRIGIVPASDTGAVEMALWSLLGERGVDMVAWESLRLGLGHRCRQAAQARRCAALRGALWRTARTGRRSISTAMWSSPGTARPRVFAFRTAISFPPAGKGLTICDATSAAFAQHLDFDEARCRHLLLAEGAGRGGRAWRADPFAARCRNGWKATSPPGRCRRFSA